MNDLNMRKSEPLSNAAQRIINAHRIIRDSRVGCNPDKAEDYSPGKGDTFGSGETSIPPTQRLRVMCRPDVMSVNEKIYIGQNHCGLFSDNPQLLIHRL